MSYRPEHDRWVLQISLGPDKRKKFYCKTKQEAIRKKNIVDYIAHYGHVETEPKTESGLRQIVLPAFIIDVLRQHRIEQLELQLKGRERVGRS